MIYELTTGVIDLKIKSLGAELISLYDKTTDTEYMWDANPEFWSRTSPVLFPFVGKLKNQQYTYKGQTFNPKPHGFARDMEFEVVESTDDKIVFHIKDDEKTKAVYPFSFDFFIQYKVEGRQVTVSFKVKNNTDEDMYFSLGAHPGFKCPLNREENRRDYYIGFDGADKIISRGVDISTGLVNEQNTEISLEDGLLPIADDLFQNDALVLENNQVKKVTLYNAEKKPYLSLEMEAPVYGIWSAATLASPFVCIEPWFGRCDASNFSGSLQEREYQNVLNPGQCFKTHYTISV